MKTLFEISQDLLTLTERLEELAIDLPGQEAAIQEWFADLKTTRQERDQKIDNYVALIKELEARIKARKDEAQRLLDRAKVDESLAQFLKQNLKQFFEQHQIRTIETQRFRVTLAKNGGQPAVLLSIPANELPEQYQVISVKPNLEVIRQELLQGQAIPGASLKERGTSLRIT